MGIDRAASTAARTGAPVGRESLGRAHQRCTTTAAIRRRRRLGTPRASTARRSSPLLRDRASGGAGAPRDRADGYCCSVTSLSGASAPDIDRVAHSGRAVTQRGSPGWRTTSRRRRDVMALRLGVHLVSVRDEVTFPGPSRAPSARSPGSRTAAGSPRRLHAPFRAWRTSRAPLRRRSASAHDARRGRQRGRRAEQHLLFGDQRGGCRSTARRTAPCSGLRQSSAASVPALVSSVVISVTPTAPVSRARLPRAPHV